MSWPEVCSSPSAPSVTALSVSGSLAPAGKHLPVQPQYPITQFQSEAARPQRGQSPRAAAFWRQPCFQSSFFSSVCVHVSPSHTFRRRSLWGDRCPGNPQSSPSALLAVPRPSLAHNVPVNGVTQHVASESWLLPRADMHLRLTRIILLPLYC